MWPSSPTSPDISRLVERTGATCWRDGPAPPGSACREEPRPRGRTSSASSACAARRRHTQGSGAADGWVIVGTMNNGICSAYNMGKQLSAEHRDAASRMLPDNFAWVDGSGTAISPVIAASRVVTHRALGVQPARVACARSSNHGHSRLRASARAASASASESSGLVRTRRFARLATARRPPTENASGLSRMAVGLRGFPHYCDADHIMRGSRARADSRAGRTCRPDRR